MALDLRCLLRSSLEMTGGAGRARGVGVRTLLLSLLVPWVASIYLIWQVRACCSARRRICARCVGGVRRGWRRLDH